MTKIRDLKLFFTIGSMRLGPFRILASELNESLVHSTLEIKPCIVSRHYS